MADEKREKSFIEEYRMPDDVVATLQASQAPASAKPTRQARKTKPFVLAELEAIAADNLAIGCPGATLMPYIRYRVWAERRRTIVLGNQALADLGVDRKTKYRVLRRLERAGRISIERHSLRSPSVTLLVS
jgi:hypothetical protein